MFCDRLVAIPLILVRKNMPKTETSPLKSLRAQLTLWFGGLLLTTLTGVALYVGQIASREITHTAGETLSVSTRASAELLATNLSEREREIELLRQALEYEDEIANFEARIMLERVQDLKAGYAWIGLTDAFGNIMQATDGMLIGQNARERPWFKGALQGLFVGDLHLAVMLAKLLPELQDNQPLRFIDIAVPIENDAGDVAGILAAHLHWTWVTDVVKSIQQDDSLLQDTELMIINASGAILYPEQHTGPTGLPANLNSSSTYANLLWPDGRHYLTSVASVGASTSIDLGWRVVMRQPIETSTEAIKDLQMQLLWLGAMTFLVIMLIAYRISIRLTRPIEDLVKVARTIEQDPKQAQFPREAGSPELTTLARALESMTRSMLSRERDLADLNASLENQVESRTVALKQANQQLQLLARTDPLTGLLNRRQFEDELQTHHQRFLQTRQPYDILMLDADHFKSVNDRFGHQTGDQVLQMLAKLMLQSTRNTDLCARYGGEEFIILAPQQSTASEGRELAERIRRLVETTAFSQAGHITISIGVSQSHPDDSNAESVIARADAALYQAKAQGRNQVVQIQGQKA